jgi:hypothetical protein
LRPTKLPCTAMYSKSEVTGRLYFISKRRVTLGGVLPGKTSRIPCPAASVPQWDLSRKDAG